MDPRCPECDEPVGATATSCMHCDAEFPRPAGVDPDDADTITWTVDDHDTDSDSTRRDASPAGDTDDDPTQLVPGVIRGLIGVAAAPIFGIWALIVVGALTTGTVGLIAGVLVWIALTVDLVRRPTIFEVFQHLCYTTAILLVLTPFIALTDAAKGGTFLGQVILFVIAEVIFGVIAAGLGGIGYRLGQYRWGGSDD